MVTFCLDVDSSLGFFGGVAVLGEDTPPRLEDVGRHELDRRSELALRSDVL